MPISLVGLIERYPSAADTRGCTCNSATAIDTILLCKISRLLYYCSVTLRWCHRYDADLGKRSLVGTCDHEAAGLQCGMLCPPQDLGFWQKVSKSRIQGAPKDYSSLDTEHRYCSRAQSYGDIDATKTHDYKRGILPRAELCGGVLPFVQ